MPEDQQRPTDAGKAAGEAGQVGGRLNGSQVGVATSAGKKKMRIRL